MFFRGECRGLHERVNSHGRRENGMVFDCFRGEAREREGSLTHALLLFRLTLPCQAAADRRAFFCFLAEERVAHLVYLVLSSCRLSQR